MVNELVDIETPSQVPEAAPAKPFDIDHAIQVVVGRYNDLLSTNPEIEQRKNTWMAFERGLTEKVARGEITQEMADFIRSADRSVREQNERIDQMSKTLKKETFYEELDTAIEHAQTTGENLVVGIFDMDRFKLINDTISHAAGDDAIKIHGQNLNGNLPPGAAIGRYGGDEFMVMFQNMNMEDVFNIMDDKRAKMGEKFHDFRQEYNYKGQISMSGGLVQVQEGEKAEAVVKRADEFLKAMKEKGRDKISFELPQLNRPTHD